jgi:hypothetical protein
MPRFSFQVLRGRFSNSPSVEATLKDNGAAWRAGADICGDLIKDIANSLTPAEPEWSAAVSDETGQMLFRFRVVAETLPQ